MDRAEEYRRRAEEAARLAQNPALTGAERQGFERIAKEWRSLEAEACRQSERRGY
jgi:hypothetical protein